MTAVTGRAAGVVALVAVLGWGGLAWLAFKLYTTTPPTAVFDLELLLRAGRAVAAGQSPYDPALLAGAAPVAERLFYSYPPVVAQLMSLVARIPSPVMFVAWSAAAVAGLGLVARSLAARCGGSPAPNVVGLVTVAFAPLLFPFAIGLLFANLDVFFPLAFGLVLLGVLPGASTAAAVEAGAAASLATVSKLHPGAVGLWLLVRSMSAWDTRRALAAAAGVLGAVLGFSLAIGGGLQMWIDYAAVIRAGSGADLVDPRNAGPAAQIALLLGGAPAAAESLARTLQIPITLAALVATVVAALRVREPVESLAWAVVASLIVLPVTWYHYPSALIPFALVALLRSWGSGRTGEQVRWAVVAAAIVAAVGIAWLPLIYVAIGLVLVAVRISGRAQARTSIPAVGGA